MQQSIQLITYKTYKYAYVRAELTPMESTYHLYIIVVNDILGSRRQEENKNFYIVLQVSLNGKKKMKIRLVKKEEFNELMELMNVSFNFTKDEDKFEKILPKLYFKDNKDMIHYGVFENDKLVASIGLYFMNFIGKYHTLNQPRSRRASDV